MRSTRLPGERSACPDCSHTDRSLTSLHSPPHHAPSRIAVTRIVGQGAVMGTRRGRRSVLVAVVVGMLLLPLVGGGGDARAARESQGDIPERQRQTVNDGVPDPRVNALQTQAQKHDKM